MNQQPTARDRRASEQPSAMPTEGVQLDGNPTPTGVGYTTPDGSHGYVYAPAAEHRRNKSFRHTLFITTTVAMAVMLLVGGIFLGAWVVAESMDLDPMTIPEKETADYTADGTSNGLIIVQGSEETADESGTEGNRSPEGPLNAVTNTENEETEQGTASSETMPHEATIFKSEPLRKDEDGDGRADIAYDQNGQVITSAGNHDMTAATVVAKVADAVVEITTETVVQSGWLGQYVTGGAGSGVIISPEGYIVTNHHVVNGAQTIRVRLTDGHEYDATLVGSDERTDVAVLWIDPRGRELTVAQLGSSYDLVVGEDILAIGNPLGSLGGTVTYGKISATAREIAVENTHMTLLQVDAPINPGNSGGALFNMAGQLVGVVNAKMSSAEIEGLGFAIPVDTAYDVILDLIEHGYVRGRPALGLSLQTVQHRYTGQYYVQIVSSLYTDELQASDLLLAIDGMTLSKVEDVSAAMSHYAVGDTVTLTVSRGNETLTVELVLREYVPEALLPAA